MAVHTGSATKPEVCGSPPPPARRPSPRRGVVSWAGSNPIATAAVENAVSSAAWSTVMVAPSTPVLASRNAWRVTATKFSSSS